MLKIRLKLIFAFLKLGSYYSPSTHSYSKSVNCNDDSDLEENLGDDENCINNLIGNKNSNKTCNKKNTTPNSQNPNSASNSSNFEFTNTNLFPVQTNVNFSNAISDSSIAVAQAITSNDILTTNCPTQLSKSTLQTTAINSNLQNNNEVEFTTNNTMTPIDKLYSMQSSYFNTTPDCENHCSIPSN